MNRNMSSESLTTFAPNFSDEKNQENDPIRDMRTMLEGMDDEETCQILSQKKRRLRIDQVKALERNFQVDNKLDPDRKVKLAQEVGLHPRQVSIWFQNRRARRKTKQMENDYVSLKATYDGLRLGFEKLQHKNESLLQEISELKSKLNESSSKQEELLPYIDNSLDIDDKREEGADEVNFDKFSESILHMKDGSSDSDSSAIFNDEITNCDFSRGVYCENTSFPCMGNVLGDAHKVYLHQPFMKIDLYEYESCGNLIFDEDLTPPSHWYME